MKTRINGQFYQTILINTFCLTFLCFSCTPSPKNVTPANISTAGSLSMGDIVVWNGIGTAFQELIAIRGKSKPFPWLQVNLNYLEEEEEKQSWIYGGYLAPLVFEFNSLADSIAELTKYWLAVDKMDSLDFLQLRKKTGADTLQTIVIPEDTTPIKITVKNGERIIRGDNSDGQGNGCYTLLKKGYGWYIITGGYDEWADFWFIQAATGKEYHTMGAAYEHSPLASPDHRFWVFSS